MKPHRRVILPLLIGMILVAFAISLAQTSGQQTDQKKQAEACCAMDSCCCHGDSCAMKAGEKTDGATATSCCGDSCDMKMKHDAKNQASAEAGGCGDSCKMTGQHDAKNHSAKHQCCAGQMANNMTAKHDMKNMKNHDMKNHDMKNGCCCCGDSCESKLKQTAN